MSCSVEVNTKRDTSGPGLGAIAMKQFLKMSTIFVLSKTKKKQLFENYRVYCRKIEVSFLYVSYIPSMFDE